MDNTPPRIAIWAAVSSKPQAAEDKASLRDQERAGREYAERVGGRVVAVYTVPGHTRDIWRWDAAERAMPAYRRLREDAENDGFDTLWALDADRLGRDPALSRQVASLVIKSGKSLWVELGGYLIDDESTATEYLFGIQAVRAREDQKRRVYHHNFGMKARIERGLPANNWPHGYEAVRDDAGKMIGGRFVPGEIEAVEMATELYLSGYGYTRIAIALSDSPWRTRGGGRWPYQSVRKMLHSDVYAGFVTYGDYRNVEPSDRFPALWSPETLRDLRQEQARRTSGGSPPASAVSGIVFCRRCRRPMVSMMYTCVKHPYRVFRCNTHVTKRVTGVSCHCNHVKESVILEILEAAIAAELASDDAIDEMLALVTPGRDAFERRAQDAERRIAEIEAKQDRLTRLSVSGALDEASVRRVRRELDQERDAVRASLNEARTALTLVPDQEEMRARLAAVAEHALHVLPMGKARALLRRAGVRVWVEDRRVVGVDFCNV